MVSHHAHVQGDVCLVSDDDCAAGRYHVRVGRHAGAGIYPLAAGGQHTAKLVPVHVRVLLNAVCTVTGNDTVLQHVAFCLDGFQYAFRLIGILFYDCIATVNISALSLEFEYRYDPLYVDVEYPDGVEREEKFCEIPGGWAVVLKDGTAVPLGTNYGDSYHDFAYLIQPFTAPIDITQVDHICFGGLTIPVNQ